jgi:hypothetical protein
MSHAQTKDQSQSSCTDNETLWNTYLPKCPEPYHSQDTVKAGGTICADNFAGNSPYVTFANGVGGYGLVQAVDYQHCDITGNKWGPLEHNTANRRLTVKIKGGASNKDQAAGCNSVGMVYCNTGKYASASNFCIAYDFHYKDDEQCGVGSCTSVAACT